jgi:acyl carrier protein
MIINSVKELQDLLISKHGYFDNMLSNFGVKLDEITPDNVSWGSIGMGDLDCVEMIMNFEKDFDIQIPDDFMNVIENTNFYEFYSKVSIAKIRHDKLNKLGI